MIYYQDFLCFKYIFLIELLSLIAPSSVDLTWYTTQEAWECPNISLRNYAALSKGIKSLSNSIPQTIQLLHKNRPDKLEEFHKEMDSISEMEIQNANSGQLDACFSILRHLHKISSILRSEDISKSDIRLTEDEGYVPTERTLRPMIRWLLMKTKSSHVGYHDQLDHWIAQCSTEKPTVPSEIINLLCSCLLYSFWATYCCKTKTRSSIYPKKQTYNS